jgi:hypothetical protein
LLKNKAMKETNFLSMGPFENTDFFSGGNSTSAGNVNVNVPSGTNPDYISMIMQNLPSIFGLFGSGQQTQQPVKPDYTPYYILGGAALVLLLVNKK